MKFNITIELSNEEMEKLHQIAKSKGRNISLTQVIEDIVRDKISLSPDSPGKKEMEVEI